jgi:arabinoxylan arabinofuranohydrolase
MSHSASRPASLALGAVTLLVCLLCGARASGGPFLPPGEYIPDGEPRVFGDRVYLYGSHDRRDSKEFCDYLLKVWSAPLSDLTRWRDEGISFATRGQPGHKDDVPWSDNLLFAPDVIKKDDKYYLYAYIFAAPAAVAVSDAPAGPFKVAGKITAPPDAPDIGGWMSMYSDPGVLVDDDAKVYMYWGFERSHMARLNPANMFEILPGTYQPDPIPKAAPFKFFEAISPRKIDGRYYIIYADGGILTYATGDAPTGPFKYGGHIISNGKDYPGGNNHGSLARLNGQWYIFYHRMTNNTVYSRIACAEKLTIEPDGSINEVEMTSLGFRKALDPFEETSAHLACVLTGGNYISEAEEHAMPVVRNKPGAVIGFKYFEFGAPAAGGTPQAAPLVFTAQIRPRPGPGTMEIWLDAIDTGTKLGELDLTAKPPAATSRPGDPWVTVSAPVAAPPPGRRALYLRFTGSPESDVICDLKSFRFSPAKP